MRNNSAEYVGRWTGDILFPHNVKDLNVATRNLSNCSAALEARIQQIVDNHLYAASSLQTAFTAAAYFLFQNGIAKDVIKQGDGDQYTLVFDQNVQQMAVQVSIPLPNVVVTLVGCALMVGMLVLTTWRPRRKKTVAHPWERIVTPHVVARVLVDDNTFTSVLLTRTVASTSQSPDNAGEFVIESISLKRNPTLKERESVTW